MTAAGIPNLWLQQVLNFYDNCMYSIFMTAVGIPNYDSHRYPKFMAAACIQKL